MQFSDDQIRNILELKEKITQDIENHQEQIEILEKNLSVLDSILKQSSFTKASSLKTTSTQNTQEIQSKQSDIIPIKKNDESLFGNAYVNDEQVSIVLEEDTTLDVDTPPFKSFFIDRIIGEMKRKDAVQAENGQIQKDSIIDCIINKNGSQIREIVIKNYRQKERINEIINTATWSFSRMIENVNK